ncbi:MAG: ankyrin repeat domain-containing protein [Bacteroidota bacterium]
MKRIYVVLIASFASFPPLHGAHFLDVADEKEGYQTPYAHLQNPNPQTEKEVFDFEVNDLVTDLEEPQGDLKDDVDSVVGKLEDKNSFFFLGVDLIKTESDAHYRCLIVSPVFKKEQKAIKKAKQKKFYLIESEGEHFLLQLLELLHIAKTYTIQTLYSSPYVCQSCHLFALHLFEICLPTNKKGCCGILFPSSEKMPTSAMAYIKSHLTLPLVETEKKDQQIRAQERKMTSLEIASTLKDRDDEAVKHASAHYNVDFNAKENHGDTPLHRAASNNNREVAKLLIAVDTDNNIRDNENQTSLDFAQRYRWKEIVYLLGGGAICSIFGL